MELTREEAIRNHRLMWNWIADETKKRKYVVKKKEYFYESNNIMVPHNNCYCCEYCFKNKDKYYFCGKDCIIVWECEGEWCLGNNSLYEMYRKLARHEYELGEYLARRIANLPEREYR